MGMEWEKSMKILLLISTILLTACASTHEQLVKASHLAEQGEINKAADLYMSCAKAGNTQCMNRLGVLQYDNGYKEAGLSWIQAAAIRGEPMAIKNLNKLNIPIQQPATVAQDDGVTALGVANAILQGYNRSNSRTSQCTVMSLSDEFHNVTCR